VVNEQIQLRAHTRNDRENPRPQFFGFERDESASFEAIGVFSQRRNEQFADDRRYGVFRTGLYDARAECMSDCQDAPEIEVVSKNNQSVLSGVIHDRWIIRPRITDFGPMHSFSAVGG